ncbi:nitroreductase family protein [Dysgonomonas sp. 216]|uniref:nitroreductase family protein n=1 Tax=Dysgonomonas sp. 216 TaxID=2302934 RepID=UPI0013D6E503|nr:nitroreductase family protein [Dysgonomonas sp. 216]NDW19633.1 nitroreductase family protein [Dysgonomonas sp. 216]
MKIKDVINPANTLLKDRYSIRKYNPSVKISKEEMTNLLQDAITAPSSLNLQPWRFVVIDSEEGKKLIKPFMMFNEVQCDTSAAIIAVFGDMQNASYTEQIVSESVKTGLMSEEHAQARIAKIKQYAGSYTPEKAKDVIVFDCGMITMQIMLAAKAYGYDTNPIGGYMKKELTEALGLDTNRYIPMILISIGKADEAPHDTIRFSAEEITQWK